jgi:transcriptional regulator with XRE-family HTH domain
MSFNPQLLASIRDKQRYSQRELAKAAGVKPSFVTMLEAGRSKKPNYPDLRAIANVLGIEDLDVFFAPRADSNQQAV